MLKYRVAGNIFCVNADADCRSWEAVKGHYAPFVVAESEVCDALFTVGISRGFVEVETFRTLKEIFREEQKDNGMMNFCVYGNAQGGKVFSIKYPQSTTTNGWVFADADSRDFKIIIHEKDAEKCLWEESATLTTCMMLSYMLATNGSDTLTMHSSCIVKDGRGFLFLGKSGTGKSTHARLWLKNVADCFLLNDDHPIIRISDGKAIVFGSPWSGKTDCYVNDSAEIGAIVKIEQAPHNRIRKLSKIEAYAKMMVSASGMTWEREMATARHRTLEKVIATVPCYELECLPDDEAARVCRCGIDN